MLKDRVTLLSYVEVMRNEETVVESNRIVLHVCVTNIAVLTTVMVTRCYMKKNNLRNNDLSKERKPETKTTL